MAWQFWVYPCRRNVPVRITIQVTATKYQCCVHSDRIWLYRSGRTWRIQEEGILEWRLEQQQRSLCKAFMFQIHGVYPFLLHFKPNQPPSEVTAIRAVRSYQLLVGTTQQFKADSMKVLKDLTKVFHTDSLSYTMNFNKPPSYVLWNLQPWGLLIEYSSREHRDAEHGKCSINAAQSEWYLSNGWPQSVSTGSAQVSWGLFTLLAEITFAKGSREHYYAPRPVWLRQRNLFTIIWLLSFFWRATYSAFSEHSQ